MPDQLQLLVISMMYEPDCVGIAAIASDMCAALAKRGHHVTVCTTYPYYPEWKLKSETNRWRIHKETINGVNVRRHRIFIPSNPSRLLPRLIHELSFPVSLLGSLFHGRRYDVVIVYCPLIGGIAFAVLRKMFFRETVWLNVQDIPVAAAEASGIIRSSLLGRLASIVQTFLFNRANVCSSISPDMIQQLETITRANMPIRLCPNWLTDSLHEQIIQVPQKVGRIPQQPAKLLYCGTIGNKQGLLQLCQTLGNGNGDFHFQIRGAGGEAEDVRSWVESSGDPRFQFGSLLSQAEFVEAIHAADWFVVPQKSSIGSSFFPSKLIPSISIGTPVLAISDDTGPLYNEVTENGLGLVVAWPEVGRLTTELDAFRQAPDRFAELQANCLRRARTYDRDATIASFEALLLDQNSQFNGRSGKSLFQSPSDNRVPTA